MYQVKTEALDFFKKHGFSVIGTGGGCEALHREKNGRSCWITLAEDGAEIPTRLNQDVVFGIEDQKTDIVIFEAWAITSAKAVVLAYRWLDDCCKHPCESDGHRRPSGRGRCTECNTFIR
tara:strand:+ start:149 stop:508 length:360 start_codon:yes stop_codon:yes gene_type:complete